MRLILTLAMMSAGLAPAQTQPSQAEAEKMKAAAQAAVEQAKPAAPAKPPQQPAGPDLTSMSPETVVAIVDGQPVTAGALRAVVGALSPQQQQQALRNYAQLLRQYGVMRRLAAEAEKNKLDQASPFKEALEMNRLNVLAQAQLNREFEKLLVPPEEVKAHYEKNQANYVQARVKAIYLPFGAGPQQNAVDAPKPMTEAEAKAKAEELVKQARAGADFVKLVKENSKDSNSVAKDGDFGLVARNAPIPEHIKTAIFGAKPGEITEPVRQPNGFYIFRIEEITTAPLEQVRASIVEQLKNARFGEWMQQQQNSVKIEEKTLSAPPVPRSEPPAVK